MENLLIRLRKYLEITAGKDGDERVLRGDTPARELPLTILALNRQTVY